MRTDLLRIEDLELRSRIGIDAAERAKPQRIVVTLEIARNLARAAHSDNITDTINAQKVAQRVRQLAVQRPRRLVERLAEEIADLILSEFNPRRVTVTLRKFVLPHTKSYGVCVERSRSQTNRREG